MRRWRWRWRWWCDDLRKRWLVGLDDHRDGGGQLQSAIDRIIAFERDVSGEFFSLRRCELDMHDVLRRLDVADENHPIVGCSTEADRDALACAVEVGRVGRPLEPKRLDEQHEREQ